MKVALVHHTFSRTGGTERYGLDLARCLRDLGDEVHLFARVARAVPGGIHVHLVAPVLRRAVSGPFSFDTAAARAVRRETRASLRPFDAVLGLGRTLEHDVVRLGGGCHAAYLEAVFGIDPRIPEVRRSLKARDQARLTWEERLASFHQIRHLIAVSHRVKAEIVTHYAVPPNRVTVIHNGVDVERFRPPGGEGARRRARTRLGLPPVGNVVLFAGNGLRRKGFFTLLDAFRRTAGLARARGITRPLRLLLAGKDPRRAVSRLAPLRRELARCDATLHAPGQLETIETAYTAADVLVLPSRYEPFGNVCLEALAAGLPVITTRANGVAEILTGEPARYLLPAPDAVDELVGHLLHLLNPGVRRRVGEAARAIALEHRLLDNAVAVREVLLANGAA